MLDDIFTLKTPFAGTYRLQRLRFGTGRPRLVLVSGLHGNELNGIQSLNLLASALRAQRPTGTIDIFPLVNSMGIDEGRKRGPFQDEDLNAAFPGDPNGTTAHRIAHALLQDTADADICVDLHSGSPLVHEIPQVRVTLSGPEVELARRMRLPLVWRRPAGLLEVTGLVGSWRAMGRRAFRVMGGRAGTLDKRDAILVADGIRRLMACLGMGPAPRGGETLADVTHEDITNHRCGTGGFFVPEVRVGEKVEPGHILGCVVAPIGGETLEEIRADRTGIVTTLRMYPMVYSQELVVRVAGTAWAI